MVSFTRVGGTNPFTGEQLSQGERDFNKFMFLMEVVTLGETAAANAGGKVAAKQLGTKGIKWTSLDPPATRFVSEADGQFLKNLQAKYAGPTRQPVYAMQPKVWTSSDPLVADLANQLEAMYPGHVLGVNVKTWQAGRAIEFDIVLRNAVIEVKGGAHPKGLYKQILDRMNAQSLPVVGYGPKLPDGLIRKINNTGGLATVRKGLASVAEGLEPMVPSLRETLTHRLFVMDFARTRPDRQGV